MVCTDWAKTVLYEDLTESERDYWYGKLCSQSPLAHQSPVVSILRIYLLYRHYHGDQGIVRS